MTTMTPPDMTLDWRDVLAHLPPGTMTIAFAADWRDVLAYLPPGTHATGLRVTIGEDAGHLVTIGSASKASKASFALWRPGAEALPLAEGEVVCAALAAGYEVNIASYTAIAAAVRTLAPPPAELSRLIFPGSQEDCDEFDDFTHRALSAVSACYPTWSGEFVDVADALIEYVLECVPATERVAVRVRRREAARARLQAALVAKRFDDADCIVAADPWMQHETVPLFGRRTSYIEACLLAGHLDAVTCAVKAGRLDLHRPRQLPEFTDPALALPGARLAHRCAPLEFALDFAVDAGDAAAVQGLLALGSAPPMELMRYTPLARTVQ